MSEPRYDLAGTGSMVVDLICATPRLLGEDEKILLERRDETPPLRRLVGGVVLNHLGWASLFGMRCAIFGKHADDPEGRFLREGMAALGIEPRIDLSGSATSVSHVYVDPRGARAIYMDRAASGELTPEEIEIQHRAVIESSAWVSTEVSQLPLPTVCKVLERAHLCGARTAVDLDVPIADAVPGLGSATQFHEVLRRAQLLKASRAGLAGLVQAQDPEAIAEELRARYETEAVVLTLGAVGAAAHVEGKLHQVEAPRVTALDTTGAGDAFFGGLLAALRHGLSWPDALRLAASCGATCCERFGGYPDAAADCRKRALELYREAGGRALPQRMRQAQPMPLAEPDALERFLELSSRELAAAARRIDRKAVREAAELVLSREARGGRVHVSGVGKPEHIAHYAASLLASTGTPASFLHATEATHGSVGQLRAGDLLIAISNSGETEELLGCVAAAQQLGASVLAVTSRSASPLGRAADRLIQVGVKQEGGPLGLVPRASVLAQTLALQALSVELQERRGFTRADYHARHPRGALGRRSRRDG